MCAQSCPMLLGPRGLYGSFLFSWNFPDKDTGVGCHFLLQGIFLTQGSSPRSLVSPALADRFSCAVPPGKPAIGDKCLLILSLSHLICPRTPG